MKVCVKDNKHLSRIKKVISFLYVQSEKVICNSIESFDASTSQT